MIQEGACMDTVKKKKIKSTGTPGLPSHPAVEGIRLSRVAAVLLVCTNLVFLFGFTLYVAIVPLALVPAWGLWRARTWAFAVTIVNAVMWVWLFIVWGAFFIAYSPLPLWAALATWLIPLGFALIACILLFLPAGRAERAAWKVVDDIEGKEKNGEAV